MDANQAHDSITTPASAAWTRMNRAIEIAQRIRMFQTLPASGNNTDNADRIAITPERAANPLPPEHAATPPPPTPPTPEHVTLRPHPRPRARCDHFPSPSSPLPPERVATHCDPNTKLIFLESSRQGEFDRLFDSTQ